MMEDWQNISKDFTPELQQQWEDWGFDYENCKEWIDIGLKPEDFHFAFWMRDIMNCSTEDTLNYGNLEESRKLYQEYQAAEQAKQQQSVEQQELDKLVGELLSQMQVPPKSN